MRSRQKTRINSGKAGTKQDLSTKLFCIRNKLIAAFMVTIIPIVLLGLSSYNKSRESIEKASENASLEAIKQCDKYLDLSLSNVQTISTQIVLDKDFLTLIESGENKFDTESMNAERNVRTKLSSIVYSNPDIISIFVILGHGKSFASSDWNIKNDSWESLEQSSIVTEAIEKLGNPFFIGNHAEVDALFTSDVPHEYALSSVRLIRGKSGEPKGLLVIDIKQDLLARALGDVNLGGNSELHLISPDGKDSAFRIVDNTSQILDTSDPANQITGADLFLKATESEEGSSFKSQYKGTEHLVLHTPIGKTGFTLIGLVPTENFSAAAGDIRTITLMFTIIAVLVAIFIGFYMAIGMSRTINRIISASDKAAAGDLTVTLASRRRDELGMLTKSINAMISNMRELIEDAAKTAESLGKSAKTVAITSEHVSSVSHEVAKAIQEIATGTSAQAVDADQGTKRMEDLALRINSVFDSTRVIGTFSEDTINLTRKGLASVQNLSGKAEQTTQITQAIISDIQSLEDHSKSIDNIVKVIGSIAEQTNLLALNAAIEAARAGEAGRGFSVVADEVRKLAEQCTQATREIAAIIRDTQNQTQVVVERAISSDNILKSQNEAVANTLEVFQQISDSMKQLSDKVRDIMDGVSKMNDFKDDTITSIHSISSVSQQIAASAEEVSASTEEQLTGIEQLSGYANQLESVAETLNEAISRFRLIKQEH